MKRKDGSLRTVEEDWDQDDGISLDSGVSARVKRVAVQLLATQALLYDSSKSVHVAQSC